MAKAETATTKTKIEQNGITRPGPGTSTGKVWDIADKISAKLKAPAPRADVLKEAETAGINAATASTQYGKWRKFNGLKAEPKAKKEPKPKAEKTATASKGEAKPKAAAKSTSKTTAKK